MNKKERVQAALLSKNLDRPPISLWMNYPEVDQEPLSLAKAHIAFQEKFDLDFIRKLQVQVEHFGKVEQ